jgi:dienelactone hydrolase
LRSARAQQLARLRERDRVRDTHVVQVVGAGLSGVLQGIDPDEPVAITGYCMGVRIVLRVAAAHPDRVAALAGFHRGGLATDDPHSLQRSVTASIVEL